MSQLFTENGYQLGEVISALQKEIRRGNEEAAMNWALELIPRYEGYFWRRLLVIVNEDIGIANPQLLYIIPALRETYHTLREAGKTGDCRLMVANAILLMSRSPKCRMADHFQAAIDGGRRRGVKMRIPDYALDRHTVAGKNKGRGVDHWLAEGCQLEPRADLADPYAEIAEEYWRDPVKYPDTELDRGGKKNDRRNGDHEAMQYTLFDK